jgi:hypothetical protein
MQKQPAVPEPVRRTIRHLLDAVDRSVRASREVERARDALIREAERYARVRIADVGEGGSDAG